MSDLVLSKNKDLYTSEKCSLLKRTHAPTATDDEFAMFLEVCKGVDLNPFRRQIYLIIRDGKRRGVTIQTSIDGYRAIANRACKSAGLLRSEEPTMWCGDDGEWLDAWLGHGPPSAAKYTCTVAQSNGSVVRRFTAVARVASYGQKSYDGNLTGLWATMPDVMIAKCAEALALRKAFPEDLGGLYTDDEMAQSGSDVVDAQFADFPAEAATPSYSAESQEILTNAANVDKALLLAFCIAAKDKPIEPGGEGERERLLADLRAIAKRRLA
jgi:phage recombination protein Bet